MKKCPIESRILVFLDGKEGVPRRQGGCCGGTEQPACSVTNGSTVSASAQVGTFPNRAPGGNISAAFLHAPPWWREVETLSNRASALLHWKKSLLPPPPKPTHEWREASCNRARHFRAGPIPQMCMFWLSTLLTLAVKVTCYTLKDVTFTASYNRNK